MALGNIQLSTEKIKLAMARKGYTTRELATECGITEQRLSAIFREHNVRPSNAGRLARALDVDVTEIID
jgi:transcriptional regulator with XRE-family HTH domain